MAINLKMKLQQIINQTFKKISRERNILANWFLTFERQFSMHNFKADSARVKISTVFDVMTRELHSKSLKKLIILGTLFY